MESNSKSAIRSAPLAWRAGGRIFCPGDDASGWIRKFASLPTADLVSDSQLRVYFATRDEHGRSLPTFIEADPACPSRITYVHHGPILELGRPGTFDDNGIMPSWITDVDDEKWLYYIGWNPQQTVSYRLSIGLAISRDGGRTFARYSEGPLLDRDLHEPYFNTAPCVHRIDGVWSMWYVSCTGWTTVNGWPEPYYHIKRAESPDGVHWRRTGEVCIDHDAFAEAIGRPCVYPKNAGFAMVYSYRTTRDYRTDAANAYRLGYAESADGIAWVRQDERMSQWPAREDWDAVMQEYATTYVVHGIRYLLFNGNGFGATGIGYATLPQQ